MEEHEEVEVHEDMEMESADMGEDEEMEEVAQIVEGTGEVEMAEACSPLECAGGGKLPPRDFQAPQMSLPHVHVAAGRVFRAGRGSSARCTCLGSTVPCSSMSLSFLLSLLSSLQHKHSLFYVSLSSLPKVITYFLTSMQVEVFLEVKSL